jgi:acyl-CoA synthetase (AMP-forming)/AMP-acid ligase II/acyl carrier protein
MYLQKPTFVLFNIKNRMYSFLKDNNDPIIQASSTYVEVIQRRAQVTPEHVVYKFLEDGINESDIMTYGRLESIAHRVAAALQRKGKKGDRVLMLYPPGLSYVASLFGCFYGGFIAVPAYPPRKNRGLNRLLSIISDADAKSCLVTRQIYNDIVRNFKNEELLSNIHWIIFDDLEDQPSGNFSPTNILPEDIALLQYTSGSTGKPKGVMITQLNLLYNSENIRQSFGLSKKTIGLNWLPVFHDMGLIGGVLQVAYLGAVNIGMPPISFLKSPGNWLRAIQKYKANTGGGPNFSYEYCVQKTSLDEVEQLDLSSMKVFFCGSEPIRQTTYLSFTDYFAKSEVRLNQLLSCYGMAETTLIITGIDAGSEPRFLLLDTQELSANRVLISQNEKNSTAIAGCGHTWMETKVEIINPDTFSPSLPHEVGEIWVSGPTVAKGYWNKQEETERTFQAYTAEGKGPFLRTGDLGFLYDNELFVTGRLKDLIIIRGANFYPSDIEFTIQKAHPDLRENSGAAFPITHNNEEVLVVVQELERTAMRNTNHDEIITTIRKAIAEEHEIEVFAVILIKTGSIPLTSSGKIQRRQSRYEYLNGELQVVAEWEKKETEVISPREKEVPTEEGLKQWLIQWIVRNQQFRLEDIDPEVNILNYGIDSLAAVTLEAEISDRFGFDWHVSSFMLNPTINGLAKEGMILYREEMRE